MIVAEQKPLDEVYEFAKKYKKVLIMGCGTCVTVCMAGGEKEVGIVANQLRLKAKENGDDFVVDEHTITRQCDKEFFDEETARKIKAADAVVSMACGVGVQYSAEVFPDMLVYPGLNTKFFGTNVEQGVWAERCAGCGECVVGDFGGVCPISRCSKSIMNGPCGGSSDGTCEINPDVDCAWQLIYDRMDKLGKLDELEKNQPIKDWSTARDGGPRTVKRDDVKL
ncbi:MAG: methylenetetrahydrofolate reductase C-terminal domain-containing protein [Fibrobacteria bacterium]|nr:methylenetetrahydrofolate reductase C-terminal domain-containing protein [Fibrobacteria bacterium]